MAPSHFVATRESNPCARGAGYLAGSSAARSNGDSGGEAGEAGPPTEEKRRYSEGDAPTWFRKKRVKLLCAEKPSSAETSAILVSEVDRRVIAVSTHSMSRYSRGERPVHIWNRS